MLLRSRATRPQLHEPSVGLSQPSLPSLAGRILGLCWMKPPGAQGRPLGLQHEARRVDFEVGRQVRLRRILLGLSQAQLASSLAISPQQVALIERGSSQLHAAQLFLLSRTLGTPVESFFSTLPPRAMPTQPAKTVDAAPTSQDTKEKLGISLDGRSNQEVKRLVKAFSRIPQADRRLRILRTVQSLTGEPYGA